MTESKTENRTYFGGAFAILWICLQAVVASIPAMVIKHEPIQEVSANPFVSTVACKNQAFALFIIYWDSVLRICSFCALWCCLYKYRIIVWKFRENEGIRLWVVVVLLPSSTLPLLDVMNCLSDIWRLMLRPSRYCPWKLLFDKLSYVKIRSTPVKFLLLHLCRWKTSCRNYSHFKPLKSVAAVCVCLGNLAGG